MTEINLADNDIDPIIEDQRWCVWSFISPKYVKNAVRVIETHGKEPPEIDLEVITACKFRGAFPTEEAARKRAAQLQSIDPFHNICVGPGFQWMTLDPSLQHATDIVYQEEKLNEIMKSHKEEYIKIHQLEAERRKQSLTGVADSIEVNGEKVKVQIKNGPHLDPNEIEKMNNNKIKDDIKKGETETILNETKEATLETKRNIKSSLINDLDKLKKLIE